MAGPAASVLLRAPINAHDKSVIIRELLSLTDSSVGDCYYWRNTPIVVQFVEEYPGYFEEIHSSGLPTLTGWEPSGVLTFIAMCRGTDSDVFLGRLCLAFAKLFDGLVDFDGPVLPGFDVVGSSPQDAFLVSNPDGLNGNLWVAFYRTGDDNFAPLHYGDATFMESWLRHPEFKMVN